jgi:hypothetical protein
MASRFSEFGKVAIAYLMSSDLKSIHENAVDWALTLLSRLTPHKKFPSWNKDTTYFRIHALDQQVFSSILPNH